MAEKYIFRGKIDQGHEIRELTKFANCLNPASPILNVEGSVYTGIILSFISAEDIDKIKLAFTYRGLSKRTGDIIRWMQPTSTRTFCKSIRLGSRIAENDATDFGMWGEN